MHLAQFVLIVYTKCQEMRKNNQGAYFMSAITMNPNENIDAVDATQKKRYVRPAIIHELELEVRTGSPLNIDPFDIIEQ